MCDTHVAGKTTHVAGTEDVTHQALVFVHMKRTSISGHNAGSILATMLQNGQPVVQQLIDRIFRNDSNDPAHLKTFIDSSLFRLPLCQSSALGWGRLPVQNPGSQALWQ